MVKSTRQASCPGREGWYPARLRVTPERDLPTPPDDFPVPSSHWGTPPSHLTAPSNHWGTPASRLTAPSSHWGTPPNRLTAPSSHWGAPPSHLTAPSNHWGTPSNRLAGPSNHLPAPVWAGAFPSFLLIINHFRQNRRSPPPCRQANRQMGYKRHGHVLGKSQPRWASLSGWPEPGDLGYVDPFPSFKSTHLPPARILSRAPLYSSVVILPARHKAMGKPPGKSDAENWWPASR